MTNAFIAAATRRRSQYALGRNLPLSQAETTALIQEAVRQAPSSFNSQSSRAVILFGDESLKFWGFVEDALRRIVPADAFSDTKAKLDGFAAGAGTVLFYEDSAPVKALQEQFPLYADNFPIWSEHSTGMAQYAVWTALAEADIGASLQHYNPLPDAAVAAEWDIPSTWTLRAQMPFGSHEGGFGEKTFIDDATRFRVHG
ncbi:nitroreductase family protein [Luteimonas terrae]|uniref:Nitroreductase family protein n=1 Tax=Luteimonas terrae TaxID=1530191 RepID=A0A4R5UDP3_9GAMM|nr:nitroreductase family protein [Luteimonas terrae]KPN20543.1 nitroreductase [Xanthomonas sp. Mitacek01]TDK33256.1 nitroreductase family protein [Luteimonas terrae]